MLDSWVALSKTLVRLTSFVDRVSMLRLSAERFGSESSEHLFRDSGFCLTFWVGKFDGHHFQASAGNTRSDFTVNRVVALR